MTRNTDFNTSLQAMMANLAIDTAPLQKAVRTQGRLGERQSRMILQAVGQSTEISAQWAQETIACMGELVSPGDQPADQARATAAFTSAMAMLTTRHMAALADVARRLQMDTVDLMLTAGNNIVDDAQNAADQVSSKCSTRGSFRASEALAGARASKL